MLPKAVLFDFDGVLADTENIHVVAWERIFAELGWPADDAVCSRAAEQDDRTFLDEVFTAHQILDADLDGWLRRKQVLTRSMLADSPRLYPGAAALVRKLQGQTRLAVVTTTWRDNVTTVLRAAGLLDAFELIVAKEDVAATKPDAAPYVLALERLGLGPADAIAIEDSPTGVASARGAGLACVAVGHRRSLQDLEGCVGYVANLSRADEMIELISSH